MWVLGAGSCLFLLHRCAASCATVAQLDLLAMSKVVTWQNAKSAQQLCGMQAGARKVYAVEASAMAEFADSLRDANPGDRSDLGLF